MATAVQEAVPAPMEARPMAAMGILEASAVSRIFSEVLSRGAATAAALPAMRRITISGQPETMSEMVIIRKQGMYWMVWKRIRGMPDGIITAHWRMRVSVIRYPHWNMQEKRHPWSRLMQITEILSISLKMAAAGISRSSIPMDSHILRETACV